MKLKLSHLLLAVITVLLLSACTHRSLMPDYSLAKEPGNYAVSKKINMHVGLVQNKALREAKWEISSIGDTWLMEIGEQLTKNSYELASIIFTEVTVVDAPASLQKGRIDAWLTPRVAALENELSRTSAVTVALEWKLEDPMKNLIWIDTITGTGEASGHFSQNDLERNNKLLKNLFRGSFQAMTTSPEISKYATSRRK